MVIAYINGMNNHLTIGGSIMYNCWFLELSALCPVDNNGLFVWSDATKKQINGISINTKKKYDIWQEFKIFCRYHGELN